MNRSAKTPVLGISIREFARRDGCSEKLVRRHIDRGGIKRFPDGSIDPASVGTGWRESARGSPLAAERLRTSRPRLSAPVPVSAPMGAKYRDGSDYGNPANVPPEVATAATAIDAGAHDLARLLAGAGMPLDRVRGLVEAWVGLQRSGWCDGAGLDWPESPISYTGWGDHPLFTGDAIGRADWAELAAQSNDPAQGA
jgi:hypothetical protein